MSEKQRKKTKQTDHVCARQRHMTATLLSTTNPLRPVSKEQANRNPPRPHVNSSSPNSKRHCFSTPMNISFLPQIPLLYKRYTPSSISGYSNPTSPIQNWHTLLNSCTHIQDAHNSSVTKTSELHRCRLSNLLSLRS